MSSGIRTACTALTTVRSAKAEFALVKDQAKQEVDRLPSQYEYFAHLRRLTPEERAQPLVA